MERQLEDAAANMPAVLKPEVLVAYGEPAEEIAKVANDRDGLDHPRTAFIAADGTTHGIGDLSRAVSRPPTRARAAPTAGSCDPIQSGGGSVARGCSNDDAVAMAVSARTRHWLLRSKRKRREL